MATREEIDTLIDDFISVNPDFENMLSAENIGTDELLQAFQGGVEGGQVGKGIRAKLSRADETTRSQLNTAFDKIRRAVREPGARARISSQAELQEQRRANEAIFNQTISQIAQGETPLGGDQQEELRDETTGAFREAITRTPEQERISQLATQRFTEALEGTMPVNPAVRRQLETAEEELRGNLRRQLGSGFETSSAGIEALQRFEETKQNVLGTQRRQDIAQFADIVSGLEGQELARGQAAGQFEQLGLAEEGQRLSQIATLEQLVQGRMSDETRNRLGQLQATTQERTARIGAGAQITSASIGASAAVDRARIAQETAMSRLAEGSRQFNQNFGLRAAQQEADIGFRERAFDLTQEESEFSRKIQQGQFAANLQNQQFQQALQGGQFEIQQRLAQEDIESSNLGQIERLAGFGNINLPGLQGGIQSGQVPLASFQDERSTRFSESVTNAQLSAQRFSDIMELAGTAVPFALPS